jgi:diphosphomevalonate decarboxylase
VAVVHAAPKAVGSAEGHRLAASSPLQAARIGGAADRLAACRSAVLGRDFPALAEVVELDSDLMHGVMETSSPPLHYRLPISLAIMEAVREWRAEGASVCYTLDAGPNVHCLCAPEDAGRIEGRLATFAGVSSVLSARPGEAARRLSADDPLIALL